MRMIFILHMCNYYTVQYMYDIQNIHRHAVPVASCVLVVTRQNQQALPVLQNDVDPFLVPRDAFISKAHLK